MNPASLFRPVHHWVYSGWLTEATFTLQMNSFSVQLLVSNPVLFTLSSVISGVKTAFTKTFTQCVRNQTELVVVFGNTAWRVSTCGIKSEQY